MSKRITADNVKLKQAYEPSASDDGTRILIDRLWPRGVKIVVGACRPFVAAFRNHAEIVFAHVNRQYPKS